jgi:hypothetical protein
VPSETQETPDLRSTPAAPPQQVRIDQNAPGAAERRKEAEDRLIEWMRRSLRSSSLAGKLEVTGERLKASELDDVKRTLEGGK